MNIIILGVRIIKDSDNRGSDNRGCTVEGCLQKIYQSVAIHLKYVVLVLL